MRSKKNINGVYGVDAASERGGRADGVRGDHRARVKTPMPLEEWKELFCCRVATGIEDARDLGEDAEALRAEERMVLEEGVRARMLEDGRWIHETQWRRSCVRSRWGCTRCASAGTRWRGGARIGGCARRSLRRRSPIGRRRSAWQPRRWWRRGRCWRCGRRGKEIIAVPAKLFN